MKRGGIVEEFEDYLDELGPIRIGTLEYDASAVLRNVDPIAYREMFWEWVNAMGYSDDDLEDVHLDLPE